jgi:hypothetical protein
MAIGVHKRKQGEDRLRFSALNSEHFVSGHSLVNVLKPKYCIKIQTKHGFVLGTGRRCNNEVRQGAQPRVVLGRWVPFRDGKFYFEKELRFLGTWMCNYARNCAIGL